MADFLKCCFPGASQRAEEDDKIELVAAAALPASSRSRHNDKLKAKISRPMPHCEQPALPSPVARPSDPYRNLCRRPSEDLQDLVDDDEDDDDDEPQHDNISAMPFDARDRAHGHVLRDLHATLQHSKWAVSGSYAEALWACPGAKRRNVVSILCQTSSRTTTKVWLTSQSLFTVSATDSNVLEYQGGGGSHRAADSAPVSVRIRWVSDRELERLGSVEGVFHYRDGPLAPVTTVHFMLLKLPALADNLALSWVKATDPRVKQDFATDLFAVLHRITQLDFAVPGSGPLTAETNVHTLHKSFWQPFTAAHPEAPALFAQCGLPIPHSGRLVTAQPPRQSMQMPSAPAMEFERPDSFQKPRSAPAPPRAAPHAHGRSLTRTSGPSSKTSSKTSSSSKPSSSSPHPPSSSRRSKPSSASSKTKHSSSSQSSKSARRHHKADARPVSPLPSPQRPVHPANILPPAPEPRSKIAVFLGLAESPEAVERRRQEQLASERAARRAAEVLAAKIQRNRVRDRERYWHTRKQAERMDAERV